MHQKNKTRSQTIKNQLGIMKDYMGDKIMIGGYFVDGIEMLDILAQIYA